MYSAQFSRQEKERERDLLEGILFLVSSDLQNFLKNTEKLKVSIEMTLESFMRAVNKVLKNRVDSAYQRYVKHRKKQTTQNMSKMKLNFVLEFFQEKQSQRYNSLQNFNLKFQSQGTIRGTCLGIHFSPLFKWSAIGQDKILGYAISYSRCFRPSFVRISFLISFLIMEMYETQVRGEDNRKVMICLQQFFALSSWFPSVVYPLVTHISFERYI